MSHYIRRRALPDGSCEITLRFPAGSLSAEANYELEGREAYDRSVLIAMAITSGYIVRLAARPGGEPLRVLADGIDALAELMFR